MSPPPSDTASASRPARLWDVGERWLDRLLKLVVALLLLAMMTLTFVDVIGRYIVGTSVPGSFELTQILLGLLIFAGLPLVAAPGDHVTVTLITDLLPAAVRLWLTAIAHVFAAGVVALIAWRLWLRADRFLQYGDTTIFLRIPLGPVGKALSMLAGIAAMLMILHAVRLLRAPVDTVPSSPERP